MSALFKRPTGHFRVPLWLWFVLPVVAVIAAGVVALERSLRPAPRPRGDYEFDEHPEYNAPR